jgi:uncharacterized membrane protein
MAVTPKLLIPPKQAEVAQTSQYAAVNVRAVIDKFTVTNTSGSNQTISVNLVNFGGTASANNLVIAARAVAPGETYLCPELIGHVLEAGQFISTLASAAGSLSIRCSGREVS